MFGWKVVSVRCSCWWMVIWVIDVRCYIVYYIISYILYIILFLFLYSSFFCSLLFPILPLTILSSSDLFFFPSLLSSSNPLPLLLSFLLPSSSFPSPAHSKYTCRVFHKLIYILFRSIFHSSLIFLFPSSFTILLFQSHLLSSYLPLQSSSDLSSSQSSHSKYTCRYLHLLIYILFRSSRTI